MKSIKPIMKRISIAITFILTVGMVGMGIAQKSQPSPPASAKGTIGDVNVEVSYFAPSARGRTVMGELVPFNEVWRTGANNATIIMFDKDVQVEGQGLPAGKYALFTIPGEDEWTIIFNKVTEQWGAFNYDEAEDALRVTVKPQDMDDFTETFNIGVVEDGIALTWENTMVKFTVE
jgi:hypothetical protein